jgi:hypothetical protein
MYINLYRFFYYKDNIMTCLVPSQIISDATLKPNVCDNKCSLSYNYNNTHLLVTQDKKTGYYNFKSDNENVPSVEYNSTKYAATGFNLYYGPVHNYDNKEVNAEIIIMHIKKGSPGDSNEDNLCICIPVVIHDGGAGGPLDMIMTALSNAMDGKVIPTYPFISEVCKNNPSDNSCTAGAGINITPANFNLGDFIPEQNYIVYAGSDIMNESCSSTNNTRYIIFNNSDPTKMLILSKTQASNTGLLNLTTDHYETSEKGPVGGFQQYPYIPGESMEDNIFIDCKPVVTSETKEKNTYVTIGTPAFLSKISFTQILGYISDYIPTVVGVILMIILWKLGNYLYGPKCPGNNCEPPLEKLKCPVNIKPK